MVFHRVRDAAFSLFILRSVDTWAFLPECGRAYLFETLLSERSDRNPGAELIARPCVPSTVNLPRGWLSRIPASAARGAQFLHVLAKAGVFLCFR